MHNSKQKFHQLTLVFCNGFAAFQNTAKKSHRQEPRQDAILPMAGERRSEQQFQHVIHQKYHFEDANLLPASNHGKWRFFCYSLMRYKTTQIPLPGGPFLLGNHVGGAFAFEFPTFLKLLKDDSHSTAIQFYLRATTFGRKSGWQTGAGNRPPKSSDLCRHLRSNNKNNNHNCNRLKKAVENEGPKLFRRTFQWNMFGLCTE